MYIATFLRNESTLSRGNELESQHRKISGYRELTQEEIDLMNEIKAKEQEVLALHRRIHALIQISPSLNAINAAESFRWAAIAKTDFQRGFMALVRAVARPGSDNDN